MDDRQQKDRQRRRPGEGLDGLSTTGQPAGDEDRPDSEGDDHDGARDLVGQHEVHQREHRRVALGTRAGVAQRAQSGA